MTALTESEQDEYEALGQAYFTRDADVAEVYRHGNLTLERACVLYALRARARRLGILVPPVVAEPVPPGYGRKPDPGDWASWATDKRRGHGSAGRDLWERQSQQLSLIEHEPITRQERGTRGHTGATGAVGERRGLQAWQEWLAEQRQGQRPPVARATATYVLTDDMEPYTGPVPREQDQPYLTR